MVETLHIFLYTIVKILKKEDSKNKVPIQCFKQYDFYHISTPCTKKSTAPGAGRRLAQLKISDEK